MSASPIISAETSELQQKIVELDPIEKIEQRLSQRLRQIAEMEDGWMDGEGLAISSEALALARDFLVRCVALVGFDLRLFPGLEGDLEIVQQIDGRRFSAEFTESQIINVICIDRQSSKSHDVGLTQAVELYRKFLLADQ